MSCQEQALLPSSAQAPLVHGSNLPQVGAQMPPFVVLAEPGGD